MKVQFQVDLTEEADAAHGRCICCLQIRVGNGIQVRRRKDTHALYIHLMDMIFFRHLILELPVLIPFFFLFIASLWVI